MKTISYLTYAWGSTILYGAFMIWLATVPELGNGNNNSEEMVNVLFRMLLYTVFFILFYRSIIVTLKNTVGRLSKWRSKREEVEDAEFVLIIETLVVIISVLSLTIFAAVEEYLQFSLAVEGRVGEVRDVMVSLMAILLTSIVVYSMPVIGELEVAIKHRFKIGIENTKKSGKKKGTKKSK